MQADGRPLYVYWKIGGGGASKANTASRRQPPPAEPQTPALGATESEDVIMVVDENAESREAENRLREERRGRDRDDRAPREVFPTGPRNYQAERDYYDRGPRRAEPNCQDGRYGFGGGYRDGGRGRYGRDDRRFGSGQSWRP